MTASKPVLRSGKSASYLAMVGGGGCGILYGWELGTLPAGNDSPEELFTTPLQIRRQLGLGARSRTSRAKHSPVSVGRRGWRQAIRCSILFFTHYEILKRRNTVSLARLWLRVERPRGEQSPYLQFLLHLGAGVGARVLLPPQQRVAFAPLALLLLLGHGGGRRGGDASIP